MGDGPWHVDAGFFVVVEIFKHFPTEEKRLFLRQENSKTTRMLLRSKGIVGGRKVPTGRPRSAAVRDGKDGGSGGGMTSAPDELALLRRGHDGGIARGLSASRGIARDHEGARGGTHEGAHSKDDDLETGGKDAGSGGGMTSAQDESALLRRGHDGGIARGLSASRGIARDHEGARGGTHEGAHSKDDDLETGGKDAGSGGGMTSAQDESALLRRGHDGGIARGLSAPRGIARDHEGARGGTGEGAHSKDDALETVDVPESGAMTRAGVASQARGVDYNLAPPPGSDVKEDAPPHGCGRQEKGLWNEAVGKLGGADGDGGIKSKMASGAKGGDDEPAPFLWGVDRSDVEEHVPPHRCGHQVQGTQTDAVEKGDGANGGGTAKTIMASRARESDDALEVAPPPGEVDGSDVGEDVPSYGKVDVAEGGGTTKAAMAKEARWTVDALEFAPPPEEVDGNDVEEDVPPHRCGCQGRGPWNEAVEEVDDIEAGGGTKARMALGGRGGDDDLAPFPSGVDGDDVNEDVPPHRCGRQVDGPWNEAVRRADFAEGGGTTKAAMAHGARGGDDEPAPFTLGLDRRDVEEHVPSHGCGRQGQGPQNEAVKKIDGTERGGGTKAKMRSGARGGDDEPHPWGVDGSDVKEDVPSHRCGHQEQGPWNKAIKKVDRDDVVQDAPPLGRGPQGHGSWTKSVERVDCATGEGGPMARRVRGVGDGGTKAPNDAAGDKTDGADGGAGDGKVTQPSTAKWLRENAVGGGVDSAEYKRVLNNKNLLPLNVYPASLTNAGEDTTFPRREERRGVLDTTVDAGDRLITTDLWPVEEGSKPPVECVADPPSGCAFLFDANKSDDKVIDGGGEGDVKVIDGDGDGNNGLTDGGGGDTTPTCSHWTKLRTNTKSEFIPCTHDGVLRLRGGGGGGVGKFVRTETADGEEKWDRVEDFNENEGGMPPRHDNRGRIEEGDPFAVAGSGEDQYNVRDPNQNTANTATPAEPDDAAVGPTTTETSPTNNPAVTGGGNTGGATPVGQTTAASGGGSRVGPPSALARAIGRLGPDVLSDSHIRDELAWQLETIDTAKRQAFEDTAVNLQELLVFCLMIKNSPHVHFLHSIQKYASVAKSVVKNGQAVGFVGDGTEDAVPLACALPPVKTWAWVTRKIIADPTALAVHYGSVDEDAALELWRPDNTAVAGVDQTLPRVCVCPMKYVARASENAAAGNPTMPHQLREWVAEDISTTQLDQGDCELLLDWCVMASQVDTPGDSLLAFDPNPIVGGDAKFRRWTKTRLLATLGTGDQITNPNTQHPPMTTTATVTGIAAAVAREVGTAMTGVVKSLAPDKSSSATGAKKGMSQGLMAKVMGFSGIPMAKFLSKVWTYWESTQDEDEQRAFLMKTMEQWADNHRTTINPAIYFSSKQLDEWMKGKFNPGSGVAIYDSAEKGASILTCMGRSAKETEDVTVVDEARKKTDGNRRFDDEIKESKTGPRSPPRHYHELVQCVTTFCSWLWAMFTSDCDYYKTCNELRVLLIAKSVVRKSHLFTPIKCRQFIWAVISDGREFFEQVLLPGNFAPGNTVAYPSSMLDNIFDLVRRVAAIDDPTFPIEWKPMEQRSGKQSGAGGGRGRDFDHGGSSNQHPTSVNGGGGEHRHHVIVKYMKDYQRVVGKDILLGRILDGANLRKTDLPKLNDFTKNGVNLLCYQHILGTCRFGTKCNFRHAPKEGIKEDWAENLCKVIHPGVDRVWRQHQGGGNGRGGGGDPSAKRQRRG